MIYEIKSLYLIIQFFIKVLQSTLQSEVIDIKSNEQYTLERPNFDARLNETINTIPQVNITNNFVGILITKLTKRYKRAPLFPVGFPFPGPGGYPHPLYPGEYAYPPGYGYGYRPYPPTYNDYMLDNQRRIKTLEKYQSLGYLNPTRMMHMVTTVLRHFWGASTLGQYQGGQPLNKSSLQNNAFMWLRNKIHSYTIEQWSTTEATRWRPPQWRPPHWRR